MTKKQFSDWAARDLIFMDGATGSNLMAAGMPQNASSELWMLDHPQPVQKLQSDYVKAGSQIIYACTFSANRQSLKNTAWRTGRVN